MVPETSVGERMNSGTPTNLAAQDDRGVIRRVGLGSLATFLAQIIFFVGRVTTVPLFLWAWGPEKYGEWLTLYAVVGYLAIVDFGMQTYVVNRLIQCYNSRKLGDYTRILHSALGLYLSIAFAAIALLAVVVAVVPFVEWLNLQHTGQLVSAVILSLLATHVILAVPVGLVRGLYTTVREFPRGVMTSNVQQFFLYGLTILVLFVGGSLLSVAAVQLVPLIGITLFIVYDLRRRHPEVRLELKERDWHLALTLLGPSSLFFLMRVATVLTLQGSILVVNTFYGSASVAVFATLRMISNLVWQIVNSFKYAVWPEITSLEARGDYRKLRAAHRLLAKLSLGVCVSAVVVLHFTGRDVVAFWTGSRIIFDQRLLDLFLLYLTSQAIWLASSLLLAATNHHRNLSFCSITSSFLGLGLAVILAPRMGLNGVVIGLWIADVSICLVLIPWDACKLIRESVVKFWIGSVLRGFPIVLLQVFIAWWISSIVEAPFLRIASVCLGVVAIGAATSYLLWLNSNERTQIASIALKIQRGIGSSLRAHLAE